MRVAQKNDAIATAAALNEAGFRARDLSAALQAAAPVELTYRAVSPVHAARHNPGGMSHG